jgi:Zn-dependent protease
MGCEPLGVGDRVQAGEAVRILVVFIVVCLVHEWGHITVALIQGVHVKKLGLSIWGTYIVRDLGPSAWTEIAIAAAGPLANLLVAFVPIHLQYWMAFNLVLGLSNLVPFGRSDGARIANHLHQLYLGMMEGRG